MSRADQRAVILLSLLLLVSASFRAVVPLWKEGKEPRPETLIRDAEHLRELRELLAVSGKKNRPVDAGHRDRARDAGSGFRPDRARDAGPGFRPDRDRNLPKGPIDINRADSAGLLPLPGIGPVFAGRIIRYRDLLGGYTSVSQLHEVYGLKPETVDLIAGRLVFDSSAIRAMDVDTVAFGDLLRHPYLQYEDVKCLLNYRDFRGTIRSLAEIRREGLLSDSTLRRIGPYLDFDR